MATEALWDDERGIVHRVTCRDTAPRGVWRLVCNNIVAELHVNSSRCVTVTCLWCIQETRGPWFPIR